MSLFDRGFIHDDKAKLVKFFTNKSMDYPDVAQALLIQKNDLLFSFLTVDMPMFAAVDWKKVSAKAFSEEEDAAEWEEVTLESSSDENTAGQIVMSS